MSRLVIGTALSLVGAAVGTAIGLLIFNWFYNQNLYAMVVPGATLGLGSHLVALDRSKVRGVVLAGLAIAVGLLAESHYFPFVADDRLSYFLAHIPSIIPAHLLMIAIGGIFGYWWGKEASPWLGKGSRRGKPVQVKDAVERD